MKSVYYPKGLSLFLIIALFASSLCIESVGAEIFFGYSLVERNTCIIDVADNVCLRCDICTEEMLGTHYLKSALFYGGRIVMKNVHKSLYFVTMRLVSVPNKYSIYFLNQDIVSEYEQFALDTIIRYIHNKGDSKG